MFHQSAGWLSRLPEVTLPVTAEQVRRHAEWAMLAVVAFAVVVGPLAHGGVEWWSLALLQTAAGVVGLVALFVYGPRMRLLWLPLAITAVGLVQVLPLPDSVVRIVSPVSADAWLTASETVGRHLPSRISVDPGETAAAFKQLFLMALLLVLAVELARDSRKVRILTWVLATVGLLVLAWGLAEWFFDRDLFYSGIWVRWAFNSTNPVLHPIQTSALGYMRTRTVGGITYLATYWVVGDMVGPYIISNHFAGCLELTLPVAMAFLLCRQHRSKLIPAFVLSIRIALAIGLAVIALLMLSVGASARMGTAGVLLGFVWVASGACRGRWRTAGAIMFALSVFLSVSLFFASLHAEQLTDVLPRQSKMDNVVRQLLVYMRNAEWRVSQWQICLRMFENSPLLGFGLGTFAAASPRYTTSSDFTGFAHCDYFQLLAEAGVVGLVIAGALLIYGVKLCTSCRATTEKHDRTLMLGLSGSLVAFLPHGLIDWNLHIPANAFLFAVILGLFLGMLAQNVPRNRNGRFGKNLSRWMSWGTWLVLIGVLLTCLPEGIQRFRAEKAMFPLGQALLWNMGPRVKIADEEKAMLLVQALPRAMSAAGQRPQSAEYAELIGRAYLHLSEGKDLLELHQAEEWFSVAICNSPATDKLYGTLLQIRGVIDMLESSRKWLSEHSEKSPYVTDLASPEVEENLPQ